MAQRIIEMSCEEFADELAAKVSVPGGGGAASYAGALAAALGSMACNFTMGKKKYAEYEDDLQRLLADGEVVRMRLLELVQEDADAFYSLSQAYGMPADDPARAEAMERATANALIPPLETMRQVARLVELLEEMAEKCSRLLVSDVGCAAALAAAALRAASLNVIINAESLGDRAYAAEVMAECEGLLKCVVRAEAVADQVAASLRA